MFSSDILHVDIISMWFVNFKLISKEKNSRQKDAAYERIFHSKNLRRLPKQ